MIKDMDMKRFIASLLSLGIFAGCNTVSHAINPFYETPPPEAFNGERNDHALNESQRSAEGARSALQEMGSFKPASAPAPYNPVMQPAVVRLMWIPDRVNRNGDLIPAHYYYLKVLKDHWSLQDTFEINAQLDGGSGATASTGAIPYTYDGK